MKSRMELGSYDRVHRTGQDGGGEPDVEQPQDIVYLYRKVDGQFVRWGHLVGGEDGEYER